MLQISPTQLNLHPFQKRYNIRLINHKDYPVVFKVYDTSKQILSTNWKFYELDRNAGFLRPGTKLQLLLTVLSRTPFKEKLQIMYGKLMDPNVELEMAWKHLKKSGYRIQKQIINISLKDEEEDEDSEDLQDSEFIRAKSQDAKVKKNHFSRLSYPFTSQTLEPIKQESQLRYLLKKGKAGDSKSVNKALSHLQKEKKKYLDSEEREELIYEKEEMERKYKQELNRSQKLSQQLQIVEKKLQNQSLQAQKFQVGHSLGIICQEYHTSFAGLAVLALASFMFGYVLAIF